VYTYQHNTAVSGRPTHRQSRYFTEPAAVHEPKVDSIVALRTLQAKYAEEYGPSSGPGFAGFIQELSTTYDPFLVVVYTHGTLRSSLLSRCLACFIRLP
jgi:hypothetical protein